MGAAEALDGSVDLGVVALDRVVTRDDAEAADVVGVLRADRRADDPEPDRLGLQRAAVGPQRPGQGLVSAEVAIRATEDRTPVADPTRRDGELRYLVRDLQDLRELVL